MDMAYEKVDCLIIGAGPTGLTLGVGLLRAGKSVLIVEKHEAQLGFSKAILVNSDSLAALNKIGAAEHLKESAIQLNGVTFYVNEKLTCEAPFDTTDADANHPISLPQEVTENCIRDVFLENGGRLMRGVTFDKAHNDLTNYQDGLALKVTLQTADSDLLVTCDWLFGCDGMHSLVREALNIPFPGVTLAERQFIMDAIIAEWPLPTHGSGWIGNNAFQFVLLVTTTPLTVRIIGNTQEACRRMLRRFEVKEVIWDGSFVNSFRLADSYGRGRVWLAGDAAHVHSPIGGRGMNYGIQDAVVLAEAVRNDSVGGYELARRPAARVWVWYNYYISQMLLSDALPYRFLRRILTTAIGVLAYLLGPLLAKTMFEKITTAQVKLRKE